ncbi:4Fe-4S cluster-binding domain-containing protein [Arthrobacter sp. 131MFCol6.1]|uniref:4Fe-4S cluster-binding domain-containing protein n=1 Tax=Arthrobacter sp. 131MFCol6.1 TaxID=1157944 RepID=UPI00035E058C|nr:4Fe-4S cluster-binding domain-containing protein [Arthrobacter sp. 131MFCol6.1]
MTIATLRIGRVLHGTTAEGPGFRSAIWFQGCRIQCRGCINPHLFSERGGTTVAVDTVISEAVDAGVEGFTLIGGEPFDQALAGGALARAAQARGLGVIVFTGYEYESLKNRDADARALLAATDLLVDGPYLAESPETVRSLVGSSNQRFIHLTERYATYRPELVANRIDVRILADGSIDVAGFLGNQQLQALATATNARRSSRAGHAAAIADATS